MYALVFVHGVFLVDVGDTIESKNSVAQLHFNVPLELSGAIGEVTAFAIVVLAMGTFVIFLRKARIGRRNATMRPSGSLNRS